MDSDKRIVKVATKLTISLKLAVRWLLGVAKRNRHPAPSQKGVCRSNHG
jgi:hypothetical protein